MKEEKKSKSAGMVDVGAKMVTDRTAVACAAIDLGPKAFRQFLKRGSPKGNVLETARTAGILAAKLTPQIIPLCHPLELNKVNIDFKIDQKTFKITIIAYAGYRGKTGVEMEALTAATAAALTIYDMMKWADKGMTITDVKLLQKTGGKSGSFIRPE